METTVDAKADCRSWMDELIVIKVTCCLIE